MKYFPIYILLCISFVPITYMKLPKNFEECVKNVTIKTLVEFNQDYTEWTFKTFFRQFVYLFIPRKHRICCLIKEHLTPWKAAMTKCNPNKKAKDQPSEKIVRTFLNLTQTSNEKYVKQCQKYNLTENVYCRLVNYSWVFVPPTIVATGGLASVLMNVV
ncbi:uncharacterized protein LOC141852610 [Brevipalpus obovatus]|uniref:uncharacterized protein LOC141852610 n=1 Tax=Brevipalpus obovatus TaxID=246614 RepID=UPI003D9F6063